MMNRLVVFCVIAIAAVTSSLSYGSDGSVEPDCNSFPKTDGSEVQTGSSLEVSGFGKLAGARVQGDYSKKEKRLLADGPDSNRAEVVMALLAYHCRKVKGLSAAERAVADQQFYEVVETLSASDPNTQQGTKRVVKSDATIWGTKEKTPIAPSARQAASLLKIAARKFKSSMGLPFMAALGGSYVPVVPYELLANPTMLSMVANQNLMEPVPNVKTIPEDDTESLAYGMCRGVQDGDKLVNEAMMRYGSKIPERLYADIGEIRDTTIYRYFESFTASDHCTVFLGIIRNRIDEMSGKLHSNQIAAIWPIPANMPSFSVDQFLRFVKSIRLLENDASSFEGTQKSN